MRFLISMLVAVLPLIAFSQTANQASLSLVQEAGFNEVEVNLDVDRIGSANDTSELSGTIEVRLNISPALGRSDELTILSADIDGSDVTLTRSAILGSYDLMSANLGLVAVTPEAPGLVDSATGEFDATQHEVTLNRGTLSGTAKALFGDPQDIDYDFAEEQVTGTGDGTGKIALQFLRIEGRKMYFEVTMELPLSLEETIMIEGSPADADTKIAGRVKATGESFIELDDYATWAGNNGLGASSEEDFDLTPTTPNFMHFSLGLDGMTATDQPFAFSDDGVTLTVGEGVALGDLEIQWSSDLVSWSRVPASAMVSGASRISLGDSLAEPITVNRDGARKFFRLSRN